MVSSGNPERLIAGHAAPADEDVLEGVVEAMAHVEHGRHVRRRHDDRERLAIATGSVGIRDARGERSGALPALVDLAFHGREIELRGEVSGRSWRRGRAHMDTEVSGRTSIGNRATGDWRQAAGDGKTEGR